MAGDMELAVVAFDSSGSGDWRIVYDTAVTSDVVPLAAGDMAGLNELLDEISELPRCYVEGEAW